ncbi:PREDICTED: histone acetyltransferase HAC2-like [Camelina sativa]|uniref:histone acetyltransferase n=1 Tax=Camelina sativa TaxID=90675 RepID=A0ABM0WPG9_CAMSA|nr:PREDICTED: histone acetyltransferase HAC2-like [Camelina sativa]
MPRFPENDEPGDDSENYDELIRNWLSSLGKPSGTVVASDHDDDVQYLGTRKAQPDQSRNEVRKRRRSGPGSWGDSFRLSDLVPFPRSAYPPGPYGVTKQDVMNNPPLDTSKRVKLAKKFVRVSTFEDLFSPNEEMVEIEERRLGTDVVIVEPMRLDEGTTSEVEADTDTVHLNHEKLGVGAEPMRRDEGTTSVLNADIDTVSLNHEELGVGADNVEPKSQVNYDTVEQMKCAEGTMPEVNADTDTVSLNHEKLDTVEPMNCDEGTKSEVKGDTDTVSLNHEKMGGGAEPMTCDEGTKSEINADTDTVSLNHEKMGGGVEPMKYDEGTRSEINADTDTVSLNHEKMGVGAVLMKCDEGTKSEVEADTTSLQKHNKRGVSVIEHFTDEEIKLHVMNLPKQISISQEEYVEDADGELCQLCGNDRLPLPPPPIYCLVCSRRIKDDASYYTPGEEEIKDANLNFCSPCRTVCATKFKLTSGITISKANMLISNNLRNQSLEKWVQCESCYKWQHEVCGLYNKDKDKDNTREYICPICLLEERKSNNNNNMPVNDNTNMGAKDLPETILSFFLEQRLAKRLKEERRETAKALGKDVTDVSAPEGLTLRVVYSADKISTVNKPLADLLHRKNYPTEFPYRSKVILLFQKVEGVDICIFALFVQEFGSECSQPNQRSTYIVYLDSVKYFRPERVTLAGEALRTFVYHEILIGYLEFCKIRGFTTSYIWACPPEKGVDYIMYSHPKTQQTPNTKKLRQWYASMLEKAVEQKVVVKTTNLYDRFFVSREDQSTCDMKAARLPYFEGSLWSNKAEAILEEIEKQGNNGLHNMFKSLTRRKIKSFKSTTCDYVDSDDCKNILLIEKLEKDVLKNKEDLMVVELNYSCTRCLKAIVSGLRWYCGKCKNLQLCESCYDSKQELPGEHIYDDTNNKEKKHQLSKQQVNVTTVDNDIIQENEMFDSRQAFLAISQKNNYIFHTLRHAKYSSMMILYNLHTSTKLHHHSQNSSGLICTDCKKDVSTSIYLPCLLCPDYRACTGCYTDKETVRHLHIFPTLASANGVPPKTVMVLEILKALQHASLCQPTASKSCSYPKCREVQVLFIHNERCKIQMMGVPCNICRGKTKEMGFSCKICGCKTCNSLSQIVKIHAYHCRDLNCPVPGCRDMKELLIKKYGVKY